MNDDKICQWCFFEMKYHLRGGLHCKKMLKRLKAKIRIGNKCKRCKHEKKKHTGKEFSIVGKKKVMILKTMCNHIKKGRIKDQNFDSDDFCDCRGYV